MGPFKRIKNEFMQPMPLQVCKTSDESQEITENIVSSVPSDDLQSTHTKSNELWKQTNIKLDDNNDDESNPYNRHYALLSASKYKILTDKLYKVLSKQKKESHVSAQLIHKRTNHRNLEG